MQNNLTASRVRELLLYEPETGVFRWRVARPGIRAGQVAGGLDHGYWVIGIDRKVIYAHRLAFLYMTGAWPIHTVDHRDGERSNNRWTNLRDVPHAVNIENVRRARTGRTLPLGVTRRHNCPSRPYMARVQVKGSHRFLGGYATPEEAAEVYLRARRALLAGNTL
jgi:hypothetical protein